MDNTTREQAKVHFKMTVANSWWQCLVALIVGNYVVHVLLLILLALILVNNDTLAIDLANIGWLLFAVWFAWWLSYWTWKKKQVTKA